ncbi:MAG TPA: serine/threonine-protein kinase, partial [Herpetosiphonaceae bacterium]
MLAAGMILQSRYRIVGPIGQGGMGAVYEAIHQQLKSRVALKQLTVAGDQLSRAFEREAQLLASLRHPALPRVIDHFTEERGQFLVMEFIEGRDLGELLRERGGAFPPAQILGWADQLLAALDYLHTQPTPIIHRDIKPPNLKLTQRGEIILLDFGLAKGSTPLQTSAATDHSLLGYTPQYAPLEQIQGAGTTERSDLFSLAATLYYLATNQQPAAALARAGAIVQGDPDPLIPPGRLNPQLPAGLNDGLMRALALDPKQRPASAAAMRRELLAGSAPQPARPAAGP